MKIPKPKKSPSLKSLRMKADSLFSKACLSYWGKNCTVCGKEAVNTHHFIAKSISAYLRYDICNGVPLCYHCHSIRMHSLADPRAIEAIIEKRGQAWYSSLKAKKIEGETKGGFMGVTYYKNVIERLKKYDTP